MKMKLNRKAKIWLAGTGSVLSIVLAWQVVAYFRAVRDNAVSFGDFLAIRCIVTAKEIDFACTVRNLRLRNFCILWINRDDSGQVEVNTGVIRGPLDGAGKLYRMKKEGWFWIVTEKAVWVSQTGPNNQLHGICQSAPSSRLAKTVS